jgi:phenylalanyl-tRNA synthetase beta chain
MLEVLARNANFNNENVRLFEMGSIYLPDEDATKLPYEGKMLTLGMYGDADFYTVKGVIENLLTLAAIKNAEWVAVADNASYHPGRCAEVIADGKKLAVFGQIHPVVAENYGVSMPIYAAEIDFDALFEARTAEKHYKPLPKFPAITRDFSFVCDEALEVGTLIATMERAGGKLVESVALFDVYRDSKLGEGKKSVSLRVSLRAADRTLTVEEADKVSNKILGSLEHLMGITIRK